MINQRCFLLEKKPKNLFCFQGLFRIIEKKYSFSTFFYFFVYSLWNESIFNDHPFVTFITRAINTLVVIIKEIEESIDDHIKLRIHIGRIRALCHMDNLMFLEFVTSALMQNQF